MSQLARVLVILLLTGNVATQLSVLFGPRDFYYDIPAPLPLPNPITYVFFSTTHCYGQCPVYDMTISALRGYDGTLLFNGKDNTCLRGLGSKVFPRTELDKLIHQIERSEFYNFQRQNHAKDVYDAQFYLIDISLNGRRNALESAMYFFDRPSRPVAELAQTLSEIADADGWINGCSSEVQLR